MNRFWKTTAKAEDMYAIRSNYATHRERGDIPGCIPAVDVFIERTLAEVRNEIANDKHWNAYLSGETKYYNPPPRKFFFSR